MSFGDCDASHFEVCNRRPPHSFWTLAMRDWNCWRFILSTFMRCSERSQHFFLFNCWQPKLWSREPYGPCAFGSRIHVIFLQFEFISKFLSIISTYPVLCNLYGTFNDDRNECQRFVTLQCFLLWWTVVLSSYWTWRKDVPRHTHIIVLCLGHTVRLCFSLHFHSWMFPCAIKSRPKLSLKCCNRCF